MFNVHASGKIPSIENWIQLRDLIEIEKNPFHVSITITCSDARKCTHANRVTSRAARGHREPPHIVSVYMANLTSLATTTTTTVTTRGYNTGRHHTGHNMRSLETIRVNSTHQHSLALNANTYNYTAHTIMPIRRTGHPLSPALFATLSWGGLAVCRADNDDDDDDGTPARMEIN